MNPKSITKHYTVANLAMSVSRDENTGQLLKVVLERADEHSPANPHGQKTEDRKMTMTQVEAAGFVALMRKVLPADDLA